MKSILLTLLFVTVTSLSFSQEISYGVRGGLNVSNLDFDPDATFSNQHRNGFAFAGFVDYGISESFSIQLELQYSAEGAKSDDTDANIFFTDPNNLDADQDISLRADYIQMPIMARIGLGEKFTIGVGPMVSLKTWENKDVFTTFTFSGVGGVEYMITDELFIDARVHYGITNILDSDLTDVEAQNTTFQFGFGIKI